MATSLLIRATPTKLYYDLRTTARQMLFSSLAFGDGRTRESLEALLFQEELRLAPDYEFCLVDPDQAAALVDAYWHDPAMHPKMLPFSLVSLNWPLVSLIQDKLDDYNPGVISLRESDLTGGSAFSYAELLIVLQKLGPHPEYCGSTTTEELASSLNILATWDYAEDVSNPKNYPKDPLLGLLADLHNMFTVPPFGEADDENADFRVLRDIELVRDNWFQSCEILQTRLREFHPLLNARRRALWDARLLTVTLMFLWNSDRDMLSDQRDYVKVYRLLVSFFKSNQLEDVPPSAMESLLIALLMHKFVFPRIIDDFVLSKVRRIQVLFPTYRSFGGRLADHVSPWKYKLHTLGGHVLEIRTEPLTFPEFLSWWGDYEDLGRVALVNPSLPTPIRIKTPASQVITFQSIEPLLVALTEWFQEDIRSEETIPTKLARWFRKEKLGLHLTREDHYWRALTRTFVGNLLYRNTLGFDASMFSWIYEPIKPNHPPYYYTLQHHFLQTKAADYLPGQVLFSDWDR